MSTGSVYRCRRCDSDRPRSEFSPAGISEGLCRVHVREKTTKRTRKRRNTCHELRPLTLFHRRSDSADRYAYRCIDCANKPAARRPSGTRDGAEVAARRHAVLVERFGAAGAAALERREEYDHATPAAAWKPTGWGTLTPEKAAKRIRRLLRLDPLALMRS